jgi:hypothetical protein
MKVLAKLVALFVGGLVATFIIAGTLQDLANRGPIDGSYVPTAERGMDERGWRTDHGSMRESDAPPKTLRTPVVSRTAPGAG